jgi:GrpB-like predicted nucleotidyltransferase (UPF0157 family)
MTEWTYFAGGVVGLEETFDLIRRLGIVWRPTRTRTAGARIANVPHLRPGDLLHFVYRAGGEARYLFRARIDEPLCEVAGAPAFDRVFGELAAELRAAGYLGDGEDGMDVLRIGDLQEVPGRPRVDPPSGRNTLWRGAPRLSGAASRTAGKEPDRPRRPSSRRARPRTAAVAGSPLRHPTPSGRAAAFFDRYLAVDWSANSVPKEGADSIWIGEGGWEADGDWREEEPVNCATRHQALAHLQRRLAAPGRVLVGFDFAFGYPAGLARWLPGDGPPWSRVAAYLGRHVRDSPSNENNRCEVAAALNRRIGGGAGPFWGCHASAASADLTSQRSFAFPYRGLAEYRSTDARARIEGKGLQSVWKIGMPGSVGGQTLMGIPYLLRLRDTLPVPFRIWPFETGWSPGGEGVTAVEIFPTMIAGPTPPGEIKDRHQVRQCVQRFAGLDAQDELRVKLGPPGGLTAGEEQAVRTEEGWILLAGDTVTSKRSIHVVEHDPAWAGAFRREADRLRGALGACALEVHHIGSTAVPGLAAKPVIDILVEVPSLDELDAKESAMTALGYEARGENGIPGRRYYQRGGAVRTHHVHAFVRGHENVGRHLAFRDYLRTHGEIADEYGRIKKAAAQACGGDSEVYCGMKNGFVEAHQQLARTEDD